jgi:hypothetical protein
MTTKTVSWPFELAKAYMADLPESTVDDFARGFRNLPSLREDVRRYVERAVGARGGALISGTLPEPYRTLGRLTSRQVSDFGRVLGADLAGFDFSLSDFAIRSWPSLNGDRGDGC